MRVLISESQYQESVNLISLSGAQGKLRWCYGIDRNGVKVPVLVVEHVQDSEASLIPVAQILTDTSQVRFKVGKDGLVAVRDGARPYLAVVRGDTVREHEVAETDEKNPGKLCRQCVSLLSDGEVTECRACTGPLCSACAAAHAGMCSEACASEAGPCSG